MIKLLFITLIVFTLCACSSTPKPYIPTASMSRAEFVTWSR